MLTSLSGAFPTFTAGDVTVTWPMVLADGPRSSGPASTVITKGAQAFAKTQIQPLPNHQWEVYGYTIEVTLYLLAPAFDTTKPFYGKLWKLLGGIVPDPSFGPSQFAEDSFQPIPPSALPFVDTIWNGDSDPVPPHSVSAVAAPTTPGLVTVAANNFPQPLTLQPTQSFFMGLWIPPTVIANTALIISQATYLITYDDGL